MAKQCPGAERLLHVAASGLTGDFGEKLDNALTVGSLLAGGLAFWLSAGYTQIGFVKPFAQSQEKLGAGGFPFLTDC